ncbi:Bll2701 protein [Sulfuriferula multivorans]|uniref:Bll2701 protein n=1 Tax=Sulfuriferula multivorans TaxID=1559896 RepID=A0A401JAQ5_9PROT|nr:patatin-like phospholipase family protein [Sulfuriferula multivorans]GBL44748.1 Bll2701 protein [Sulfuriferula multivorans]
MPAPQPDPADPDAPLTLAAMLQHERAVLDALRVQDGTPANAPRVGLAFSGGGIRSATFNLGVIQALAERKLLRGFDYLSTVSGGGYIGGWLAALIRRKGNGSVAALEPLLACGGDELTAVRFLRSYSNYLTPHSGLLSADTLGAVATYLRNLYLNLSVLILSVAALLLLPRLLIAALPQLAGLQLPGLGTLLEWSGFHSLNALHPIYFGLGGLSLLVAVVMTSFNLVSTGTPRWYCQQGWVLRLIVLPTLLAAALFSYGFFLLGAKLTAPPLEWMKTAALLYALPWLYGRLLSLVFGQAERRELLLRPLRSSLVTLLSTLAAGALGGLLFYAAVHGLRYLPAETAVWWAVGLGTPLILKIFSLVVVAHIGFMGRDFSNAMREWWSRLGGWILIIGLAWLALFVVAIYALPLLLWASHWAYGGGAAWLASTVTGLLLGSGPATAKPGSVWWKEWLAKSAPWVFISGLLILLSALLQYALSDVDGRALAPGSSVQDYAYHCLAAMNQVSGWLLLGVALACVAAAALLSWRVDINLFALYYFYRDRLVRCYLGASRQPERAPQLFTGFDPADDLALADLVQRPYPIFNTAINLVKGSDLAWQQRKAAAFSFTPSHCGFSLATTASNTAKCRGGYRPSAGYLGPHGAFLGTAMAISGAAASPNMGYHSSPALCLLMTVFNLRLGHWSGNPCHPSAWRAYGPKLGGRYLLSELFGLTDSDTPFVYLSDGGHFENLGIYELVRRRCNYIVAIDAGQDEKFNFDDLGNAIRKCYTDFGVRIDIDVNALRPDSATGLSLWSAAVGRIHYPDAPDAQLLYLKPTLACDIPSDVFNYAVSNPGFPHQRTSDQDFDEAQFESYRKLGHHLAAHVFDDAYRELLGNHYNAGQDLPNHEWAGLFRILRAHADADFRKQAKITT